MMRTTSRSLFTISVTLLVAGAVACKGRDADTTDSAGGTTDSSAVTPAPASLGTSGWNMNSIVGFALAANSGEVELGNLGKTKATNPAVKEFAGSMVADHTMMLNDTKALATKLNAVADTASGDAHDLMEGGKEALKSFTEKAAGADWDEDFMEKMVDDHKKVLDKLNDAMKNTTDAELQGALQKSIAKVQEHLTKAEGIKAKLKG